jgi:hypothetical protein
MIVEFIGGSLIRVIAVLPGIDDMPMVRSSGERFDETNEMEETLQQWGDNQTA